MDNGLYSRTSRTNYPLISIVYEPHTGEYPNAQYEGQHLTDRSALAVNPTTATSSSQATTSTWPASTGWT